MERDWMSAPFSQRDMVSPATPRRSANWLWCNDECLPSRSDLGRCKQTKTASQGIPDLLVRMIAE